MKPTIIVLMMLLLVNIAFALDQPPSVDPLKYVNVALGLPPQTIAQPTAPSTDSTTTETCSAWTTRNEKCSGSLRIYEQCIRTASGNSWDTKSYDCKEYGDNVVCESGACIKESPSIFDFSGSSSAKTIAISSSAIIIAILAVIIFLNRRK